MQPKYESVQVGRGRVVRHTTTPTDQPEDGSVQVGEGRVVCYATTGKLGQLAVVFQPLGFSRVLLWRDDVVNTARRFGLRLVCVDRPGIGGTSPVSDGGRSSSLVVRTRLATHSRDVRAVVDTLGGKARLIGLCAGTQYLLHFVQSQESAREHVTLVTPWVSPECRHVLSLARAARWIGAQSVAGYLLAAMELKVAILVLLALGPKFSARFLLAKFTPCEREELRVAQLLEHLLKHVQENAKAHTTSALTHDVRVCLASYDEIFDSEKQPVQPLIKSATVFAADRDDVVNHRAVIWFVDFICPNARLYVFRKASHVGVHTLRLGDWLGTAATEGATSPSFHRLNP